MHNKSNIQKIIFSTLIIVILLSIPVKAFGQKVPKNDYFITALQLSSFLYLQFGLENSPKNLVGSGPNSFDKYFRKRLLWEKNQIDRAEYLSDVFLYGLFVGSIPLTPVVNKDKYMEYFLTNLQVISLNGIITNTVKILSKRQRPDAYYKTREYKKDQFRSFFSGHTSTAFALGTSSAILVSRYYPEKRNVIWASTLGIASWTGYLRVAADKHYVTDVLVGGIVGSFVGVLVQNSKNNNFSIIPTRSNEHKMIRFSIDIH